MYITTLQEFNQISGMQLPEIDTSILRRANMLVDRFISPQPANSIYTKAIAGETLIEFQLVNGAEVTLKKYKQGFFDFTYLRIRGTEYAVVGQENTADTTILTLDASVKPNNTFGHLYQKTQAPFAVDVTEKDNYIAKHIRDVILQSVVLQYQFLLDNPNQTTNQKTRERVQNTNYEVEFRDNRINDINQLIHPEARILLNPYRPYVNVS